MGLWLLFGLVVVFLLVSLGSGGGGGGGEGERAIAQLSHEM